MHSTNLVCLKIITDGYDIGLSLFVNINCDYCVKMLFVLFDLNLPVLCIRENTYVVFCMYAFRKQVEKY